MNYRPWLYCAGKIAANDWRNDLFGTRDITGIWNGRGWEVYDHPPRFVGRGNGGDHPDWRYAGPFFVRCDHKCGHGAATHGCGANEPDYDELFFGGIGADGGCLNDVGTPSRAQMLEACFDCIRAADCVFVWIDEDFATAHGTMTEIGYAAALGKPIYAARSPAARGLNMVEMWFPLSLVTCFGERKTPEAALHETLRWYRSARK
jgi:hypothetical protein